MKVTFLLTYILICCHQTSVIVLPDKFVTASSDKTDCIPKTLSVSNLTVKELLEQLSPIKPDGNVIFLTDNTRKEIFNRLLTIARHSAREREKVITELVNIFGNEKVFADTRLDAAYLLAELKAVTALDIFFANLELVRGLSIASPNIRPVWNYIVLIGDAAIPYLAETLSKGNSLKRQQACLVLGFIGGAKARRLLEKVSLTETDSEVKEGLKYGLQEIKRQSFTR
jgi:hypothetical protein